MQSAPSPRSAVGEVQSQNDAEIQQVAGISSMPICAASRFEIERFLKSRHQRPVQAAPRMSSAKRIASASRTLQKQERMAAEQRPSRGRRGHSQMSKSIGLSVVIAILAASSLGQLNAEPLASQGIGTSNCGRLASDLKPSEGLANPVNLMLYSWVQGYVSAANVALLEAGGKHVDMSAMDESKVLDMVLTFCKAHPDKKPAVALDDYLRTAAKLDIKWERGTIDWGRSH
jgi:hypothetical protein